MVGSLKNVRAILRRDITLHLKDWALWAEGGAPRWNPSDELTPLIRQFVARHGEYEGVFILVNHHVVARVNSMGTGHQPIRSKDTYHALRDAIIHAVRPALLAVRTSNPAHAGEENP